MESEFMPDDMNDRRAYGFRSAQCNGVAYDPTITYAVPLDAAGAPLRAPTFTAAWTDGFAKTGSTNLDQTVVTFTADSDVSTGTGNRTFTFSSSGFTASTFAVGQSITLTGSSSRSLTGIVTSWGRNRSDDPW